MGKTLANKQNNNSGSLSVAARRRQREREERYQTILKAAETLFSRDGYHQTSINQIAELAEVSVGTVYFYFKNKEDLLIQLLDEISYLLRKMVGAEFRKTEASLDGFMRAGKVFFSDFCRLHPEKVIIMYRESVGQSPLVSEHIKKVQDKIGSDIIDALERVAENTGQGFPGEKTAEIISTSILGIYDYIASKYLFSGDNAVDIDTVGDDAVNFLIGGIQHLCNLESNK